MGYGIVVWCDDRAVRRLIAGGGKRATETVGRDLAAALGADAYPAGGVPARRAGPFAAVGAWPAHRRVIIAVDGRGATVADVAGLGAIQDRPDEPAWVAQLAPGAMATRERAAIASPGAYRRALAEGRPFTDVLYGSNRVAGASIASLWWFYADALAGGPPDPRTLGEGVISLVDTHFGGAVAVGRHLNALNKAGALLADVDVRVVWTGNQLRRDAVEQTRRAPSR